MSQGEWMVPFSFTASWNLFRIQMSVLTKGVEVDGVVHPPKVTVKDACRQAMTTGQPLFLGGIPVSMN